MINTQTVLSFLEKDSAHSPSDYYGEDTKTVYEIAETLNCGIATVNRLLKKFGIKKDISLRNKKINSLRCKLYYYKKNYPLR